MNTNKKTNKNTTMNITKFNIRSLSLDDYSKNYKELLNQLSPTEFSKKEYLNFIKTLFVSKNHFIQVVEIDNCIVASGTLIIEQKLIHNCGKVGHIEDIVVDLRYRKFGIGKQLVKHLVKLAKKYRCYKVILDCKDSFVYFYEKCGFQFGDKQMSIYF